VRPGIKAKLTFNYRLSSSVENAAASPPGLMELIALNIGYDMGILSKRIFTMLVIMTLVITVMTGRLSHFSEKGVRLA
jgi:Kef-type K+ transport system membrane component KefB